ncbi:hypothetical protein P280DRAFT_531708 [Massarina eburnea CBS 473.64]|uniref:Uncharacterized protein n=1 Tax=Massarina eburnea CBS 473.64 TaxID=1395130 RepID=A0A6A6SEL5_9PLEO|nr:hypothetical protein P280DRAFT_531708 [Massarina eburnea CBS 473.64]
MSPKICKHGLSSNKAPDHVSKCLYIERRRAGGIFNDSGPQASFQTFIGTSVLHEATYISAEQKDIESATQHLPRFQHCDTPPPQGINRSMSSNSNSSSISSLLSDLKEALRPRLRLQLLPRFRKHSTVSISGTTLYDSTSDPMGSVRTSMASTLCGDEEEMDDDEDLIDEWLVPCGFTARDSIDVSRFLDQTGKLRRREGCVWRKMCRKMGL